MTQWVAFTGIVTLLTAAMVGLSVLTQRSLSPVRPDRSATTAGAAGAVVDSVEDGQPGETGPANDGTRSPTADASVRPETWPDHDATGSPDGVSTRANDDRIVASIGGEPISKRALLVNVVITQGLFLALVAAAIVLTGVPTGVLGIEFSTTAVGTGLVVGLGAGLGLFGASEVGGVLVRHTGIEYDAWLRESLAPSTLRGWIGLVVVVLPLVALFEELLFRGVLIGAFGAGFGVSPWLLAVGSSLLFAVGHGIQGTAGVVVTGVVGFVLAALFVVTGNLLLVVVAHYVLNACEFVVHEGPEFAPTDRAG